MLVAATLTVTAFATVCLAEKVYSLDRGRVWILRVSVFVYNPMTKLMTTSFWTFATRVR